MKSKKKPEQPAELKGWIEISRFLGQPVATAQHWKQQGLPITRSGRNVVATPEALNDWLGRDQHIVRSDSDLSSELKRSLKAKKKKAA